MTKRIEALITPALLKWGRESAGYDVDTAAAKASIKHADLVSWESGETKPSIPQLRKLANLYKRPIAVFYLSEIPQEFTLPKDYRRSINFDAIIPSPELRLQLREMQSRRDLLLELYEQAEDEQDLPPIDLSLQSHEDPEKAAERIRAFLSVSLDSQKSWNTASYDAMNNWRSAFEKSGVLVFQMRGVPRDEAKGFSVHSETLPLVVVNVKDAPNSRIFTMLHELTHIALRQGGICDLEETVEIEVFCNAVAGAVLVPRNPLLRHELVQAYPKGNEWQDDELYSLAQTFRCSRDVVLRRLLVTRRVTKSFYERKKEQFDKEFNDRLQTQSSGPVPPARRTIANFGHLFVRVALNNYYQNNITGSDLADFLQLRMKHLPVLEAMLEKKPGVDKYKSDDLLL